MIGPKPKIIVLQGGQPEAFADAKIGNAVHSAGGFSITIYGGLPDFTGVLAQEWREIEKERVQGLIGGIGGGALTTGALALVHVPGAIDALFGVAGVVGGYVGGASYDPISHEVESHALTALVNEAFDKIPLATALGWGADSLSKYDNAGKSDPQVWIDRMKGAFPKVRPWMLANHDMLQDWQKIRLPVRGPQ